MKTYRVMVNGEIYAVTIEEIIASTPGSVLSRVAAPVPTTISAPAVSAPPAPPKPVAPPPAPKPTPVVSSSGKAVQAPMPGKVLAVKVAPGDAVKSGTLLVILEAMKMENDIMAPVAGTVAAVNVRAGDSVSTGEVLVVID